MPRKPVEFQRRHYEAIAEIIGTIAADVRDAHTDDPMTTEEVACAMGERAATFLRFSNPRFETGRFVAAVVKAALES